jgi:predicted aspartyl protease
MGTFTARIGIANPEAGEFQYVDALVDTGASHTMFPASLLEQMLHLAPEEDLTFTLGDGREQVYGFGTALMRIQDRQKPCPVVFGPEDQYLLGATTLQNFNLVADTNHHRLIPTPRLTI